MKLSKYETETHISYNDDEEEAYVYTCNKALIRKVDGFCLKSTVFTVVREDKYSKTYKVPKKCVRINFPRLISNEKRSEMILRAKNNFGR